MNKKAQHYGTYIFIVILLVSFTYFGRNYVVNDMYEKLFAQCESFCINNSQTYYGVDNFKEYNRACVCDESKYRIYRSGKWDFIIANPEYYNEEGKLVGMSDRCVKEIICQMPNSTEPIEFDLNLVSHESCYDLVNDPDNIRGYVNNIFEEHPDDWEKYINWSPSKYDPTATFIVNNTVEEVTCENIYVKRSEIE